MRLLWFGYPTRLTWLAFLLTTLVVCAARLAHAELATASSIAGRAPAPTAAQQAARDAPAEPNPEEAKRHFQNGVRFFQDHNYGAALVEFDASFQQNPTAVALQNIGVCQKALFRYPEAITTLERLLREFGTRISSEDRQAVAEAIRDMGGLVGTLVMMTTPADARVSINDKPLSLEARRNPVRLAAGEYVVTVEAPGYVPHEQTIAVVSQKERVVEVALEPQTGTLRIRTADPQAAIAIDGIQVGYEDWKGAIPAGPHEVTVYTARLRHRTSVMVLAGQRTDLDVKLTEKDDLPPAYEPGLPTYVPPPPLQGWFGYGLVSGEATFLPDLAVQGGVFKMGSHPKSTGVLAGVAAGYRFSALWAAEVLFQAGSRNVFGCSALSADADCSTGELALKLSSIRLSAGVRMMTAGRRVRLFATGRLGGASQVLYLPEGERHGGGLIGQLGGGVELSLGHVLANAALIAGAEGAGGMGSNGQTPSSPIASAAIEVRIGYAQW